MTFRDAYKAEGRGSRIDLGREIMTRMDFLFGDLRTVLFLNSGYILVYASKERLNGMVKPYWIQSSRMIASLFPNQYFVDGHSLRYICALRIEEGPPPPSDCHIEYQEVTG